MPHAPNDPGKGSAGRAASPPGETPSAGPRARWVTEVGAWRDMARAWDELAALARPDNPFLTHDWLMAWWEVYGVGRRLALAVVEDGERLMGVAPLWSGRRGQAGVALRTLSYLGGDFGGAEYLDFLVPVGGEKPFFAALVRLMDGSGHDRLCLERHDAASRSHVYLKVALANRPVMYQTGLGYTYPCLTVPETRRDFETSPLAAWAGAGEQTGRIRIFSDVPADRREEALARLCDLHQAQAARRGDQGAFDDPRKRSFYAALAGRLAGTGRLRLSGVLVDGEFAAVEIGIGAGAAHFALESGASPEAESLGLDRLLTASLFGSLVGRASSYTSLKYHDPHIRTLPFVMRPTLRLDAFFGARGRAAAALKALAGLSREALGFLTGK
ncbi:GNAT family N-acetyltransferase [Desulfolutivibrio sulfoxidireducens]|uniref:GNAT family N-acetyltransferase n=1 Tax=Desulfolutivibrio sulfoxidireducens TaxID=2773299 RepID=UPI00159D4A1E|nr:GNAT family N-acetyltransferase [Desulfolutivibrio sulfoxidireducens]QLA18414.1 GNAT family N-acetyltransferase [Desulfolutivibrio sulfoxidireducens]